MKQLNNKRILVKVLQELSVEIGFEVQFLSESWITVIKKGSSIHYIYGYEWGLNSSTAQLIAKDKEAAYEILSQNHINAIEHKLFFNYGLQAKYMGQKGCWNEIMKYAQEHKSDDKYTIVCKPNKGTGGNDVNRISDQWELESTIQKMFSKYRDLCLCPFYKIENEYRGIFLDGETLLLYRKERPYVVGNGKDTLAELVIHKYKKQGLSYLIDLNEELEQVVPQNEKKFISWKHNLGNGAKGIIVEDEKLRKELAEFMKRVADALGIRFASIDIAVVSGVCYVMEVNSGIMIENFAVQEPDAGYDYYEITKNIYRKAVKTLLGQ